MTPILPFATKMAQIKNYCASKSRFRLTMFLKTCLIQRRCDYYTLLLPLTCCPCSLVVIFPSAFFLAQYCEESTSGEKAVVPHCEENGETSKPL